MISFGFLKGHWSLSLEKELRGSRADAGRAVGRAFNPSGKMRVAQSKEVTIEMSDSDRMGGGAPREVKLGEWVEGLEAKRRRRSKH